MDIQASSTSDTKLALAAGDFRPPQFKKAAEATVTTAVGFREGVARLKATRQLLSQRAAQLTSEEDIVRDEDIISARSARIAEISRILVEEDFSCFDIWPLALDRPDVETIHGVGWVLDQIGLAAHPGPQELIVVVARMTSTKYYAWVRDGSYGFVCVYSVAKDRRFHAIVDRVRESYA